MDVFSTFFAQNQKLLISGAIIALVVLMALSVANTALFVIDHWSQTETTAGPAPANTNRQTARLDTSQIRNLFGAFQAEPVTVQQEDVPETSLNLELQGIFTADEPENSTAIVAQRGQSGQLYGIGDRLPGNATLEAVNPTHILIKRGARTEKLAFDDASVSEGFSKQSTSSNQVASRPTSSSRAEAELGRLSQINERITNRRNAIAAERGIDQPSPSVDIRSAISSLQDRLEEDPDTVMQELGVTSSGDGFKLGGQVPDAMLRQAGLRRGDVILSVNGQSAAQVAGDRNLMNQVMQSQRARVEVQRGDRRFVVTVPIPKS